jgi:uncharacterized membrane protein
MTKRQTIQYNDQKTDNTIQWPKDRQYNDQKRDNTIQWPKDRQYNDQKNCIVCLLVIVLSVFWSLYCLSFSHCIVLSVFWSLYCIDCLLVIVLSVFWSLYCIVCLLVIVLYCFLFWSSHCVSFDIRFLINILVYFLTRNTKHDMPRKCLEIPKER